MKSLKKQMIGLNKQLKDNKVFLKNKLIQLSLTPYLIKESEFNKLKVTCESFLSALEISARLYTKEQKIQAMFPELAEVRNLSLILPAYKKWIQLARFDFIRNSSGEFKLLETNCDCPGGIIMAPLMKHAYQKTRSSGNPPTK